MPPDSPYGDQLKRIAAKLKKVRECDRDLQVFGASSHKYEIGPPLDETTVIAFERQLGVNLPLDYVAFLTTVGHGSPTDGRAATGPFYGIDPLERNHALMGRTASLSLPPIIQPDMQDEDWAEETKRLSLDEDELSDEAYDREQDRIYAGLMAIGHQGCESYHAILVEGPHKGRVVNVDTDGHKPKFAYENNFLDWYERWLDEVISGGLLQPHAGWFGYTMGGDDTKLMQVYDAAHDGQTKLDALRGLMKLKRIEPQTCERLDALCQNETGELLAAAVHALTKFNTSRAVPHLERLTGGNDADRLTACQAVHWYAKSSSTLIAPQLLASLANMRDEQTFRFTLYVLEESGAPYADAITPFTTHPDRLFRQLAFFHLGKTANKNQHLATFLHGLRDAEDMVVHVTLQALGGVTDKRLLPAFQEIADRYPTEKSNVRINLEHRLKEHGFESIEAFEQDFTGQPFHPEAS